MKTKYFWIFPFLFISLFVSAQQENLNHYLKIAAENNPKLKAAFYDYMSALEIVPQVKTLPDPQIAFAYFISPIETRLGSQRLRISVSQFFPWFGTLKAQKESAAFSAKVKYELFQEVKALVFKAVKTAYFNLYFSEKSVQIIESNLALLKRIQQLAIVRVESGSVSVVDEYKIEMEINGLENQILLLKDKQVFLRKVLLKTLNTKEEQSFILPETLWRDDFQLDKLKALQSMLALNHQLLSLEFEEAALQYKRKLAKLDGRPSFKIGLDYFVIEKGGSNLSGKDAFVFPTIGLTVPLYRTKYKAKVREIIYLETAKGFERENKKNRLQVLFEKSWNEYKDSKRRILLYEEQCRLALKTLKILETNYATGKTTFEEVLQMERQFLTFSLEREKAVVDKQVSISFLNYLTGK